MRLIELLKGKKHVPRDLRHDILLYIFSQFLEHDKKEVSLYDFNRVVSAVTDISNLGYDLKGKILYDIQLSADVQELIDNDFIRKYRYVHNGYLPKTYFAFTTIGRGHTKNLKDSLSEPLKLMINEAVLSVSKDAEQTWEIFSRPVHGY